MTLLQPLNKESKWAVFLTDIRRRLLNPKPRSGIFSLDLFFVFSIAVIQIVLFRQVFDSRFELDFVTIWVVFCFVLQSPLHSIFMGVLAGLAMEAHSSYPSGIYLSFYFILYTVLLNTRDTLSWRHFNTWAYVLLLSIAGQCLYMRITAAVITGNGLGIVYDLPALIWRVNGSMLFALAAVLYTGWADLSGDKMAPHNGVLNETGQNQALATHPGH